MWAQRVLVVMPEQWPRALLRAALREIGYDAVGTRELRGIAPHGPGGARGALRLVIVDEEALGAVGGAALLDARRSGAATLLIAPAIQPAPAGDWDRVLRRPASIGEIVRAVEEMVPLAREERKPLD